MLIGKISYPVGFLGTEYGFTLLEQKKHVYVYMQLLFKAIPQPNMPQIVVQLAHLVSYVSFFSCCIVLLFAHIVIV